MSGGHFNYIDSAARNEIFGYSDEVTNAFEDWEISELVWDVLNLIHEYDWYASGDTDKQDYLEAKAEFKAKWLEGNRDERIKETINKLIEKTKQELYETYIMPSNADHRKQRGRTAPNRGNK